MAGEARARLHDIDAGLDPRRARGRALEELDELFRSGAVPEPAPDGYWRGRLLATRIAGPVDALGRRLRDLYMPWRGKRFTPSLGRGVNVFAPSARLLMRLAWPGYVPELESSELVEAFPFKTAVGHGAIDSDVRVLKIDYDLDPNPDFVVRRVLDELVQVDDGLLLGKVLVRSGRAYRALGFFTLER